MKFKWQWMNEKIDHKSQTHVILVSLLWSAKWSPWGRWGTCSVTCGGGRRIRRRTCVRTSVTVQCAGRPAEIQKCGKSACPSMLSICCKSHDIFLILMSLLVCAYITVSFICQPNVSVCAPRVVPVRTAACACVTVMCCTEKSTVWPVSLWQEPGWHWPVSPRWYVLVQMPKVSSGSQESAPPAPPWSPSGRRSSPWQPSPPPVTPQAFPGYGLSSNQLVSKW